MGGVRFQSLDATCKNFYESVNFLTATVVPPNTKDLFAHNGRNKFINLIYAFLL